MAMMAVTQKINRAAFDIFIRVFVSLRASNRICSTEVQLTLCSSALGYCADASDKGKQNIYQKVTELLPTPLDWTIFRRDFLHKSGVITYSLLCHRCRAACRFRSPELAEQIKSILKDGSD